MCAGLSPAAVEWIGHNGEVSRDRPTVPTAAAAAAAAAASRTDRRSGERLSKRAIVNADRVFVTREGKPVII